MLNLGILQFGLGVNTSGLDAAIGRVQSFGRTVQGAQIAANRGFETSIGMLRRQENAILTGLGKLRTMQEQINRTTLAPQVKLDAIQRLNTEYDKFVQRASSGAIGLDPTKIDRAVYSFNQAGAGIMQTFQGMDRASRNTAAAIERQASAVFRADQAARNLGQRIEMSMSPQLGKAMSPQRMELMQGLETAMQRFRTQMAQPVGVEQAKRFQREWTAALNDIQRRFRGLGGGIPAASALENWRMGLRGVGDAALLLSGHLGGLSTRFFALSAIISSHGLKWGAVAGAVVGAVGAFSTVTRSAVQSRLELEKMTKALTALEGNSAVAAVSLDYVREVSDKAGIAIQATGNSYARMTASGKAAGMTTNEIRNIFEAFSMAAGTLSLSMEDTQGVFRALDQIMSKGTVQAEELRGQLGDRLPGAFAIAADAMGVTTRELNKMMKEGDVISREFLPKFTEQMKIALGIDMNKRIETLQASMQRLQTSWLFFGQAVDKTFGITEVYKKLLDAVAETLDSLSQNMAAAVGVVGALGGALTGLAAAIAMNYAIMGLAMAWGGLAAAGRALIPLLAGLRVGFLALTGNTLALASAQATLGATLAVTPWGAVASAVIRLAAIIAGAYFGYTLFTKAANEASASLADTSAIDSYIAQQKRLGWQVEDTTQRMIKQAKVAVETQAITLKGSLGELRAAQEGPGWQDYARSGVKFGKGPGGIPWGIADVITPAEANATRVNTIAKQVDAQTRALVDSTRRLQGLSEIATLPTEPSSPILPFGDEDDKKKKGKSDWEQAIERAQKLLKGLQDDAANASLSMQLLFVAEPDFRAVDALMEARGQLQGMSELELKALGQEMGMAGASMEQMAVSLAGTIETTNRAEEAVKEFRKAWEDIDSQLLEMQGLKTVNDFLLRGGNPDDLWVVESVNKAYEAVEAFTKLGPEGAAALKTIHDRLIAMGYAGETAADSLAKFYQAQEKINRQNTALEEVAKSWGDIATEIEKATILAEAYARGTAVGEAAERMLDMTDKITEFRRNMEEIYGAGTYVDEQTAAYADQLAVLDATEQRLERVKQRMEQLRDIWNDAFSSMYENLKEVAAGTKSVLDAITDLFMGIVDQFAKNAVDVLAEGGWNAIFGDPTAIAGGIVGGRKPGDQGHAAATRSMNHLTSAAHLAAEALLRIANGGMGIPGVMPGAGGGGGILGSILGAAGSIFGSGGFNFSAGDPTTVLPGWNSVGDLSTLTGRAMGGPVTAGWLYKVNEQGAEGEIFSPGVSGWVGKSRGSAGTTMHIDQSTVIDARGATPDAIAELKQEMRARDARLRNSIPFMIDHRTRENRQRLRQ